MEEISYRTATEWSAHFALNAEEDEERRRKTSRKDGKETIGPSSGPITTRKAMEAFVRGLDPSKSKKPKHG